MDLSVFVRWKRPIVWAVATFLIIMLLTFPVGCTAYDAPAGYDPPGPECPEAPTLIGLVWPHLIVGFVVAPILATLSGIGVAFVVRRRSQLR